MNSQFLQAGREVTLCLPGRRVPSRILAVAQDTVGVTMDTEPFPDEGMGVSLEFATPQGACSFYTRVIIRPREPGGALILMRAPNISGAERRRTWRIPMSVPAPVRRIAAGRAESMLLVDISTGGALLETGIPLQLNEMLDICLALPEQEPHVVRARVVRAEAPAPCSEGGLRFGVLFVEMAADARRELTHFMWERLLRLYPKEMARLFPGGKAFHKLHGKRGRTPKTRDKGQTS